MPKYMVWVDSAERTVLKILVLCYMWCCLNVLQSTDITQSLVPKVCIPPSHSRSRETVCACNPKGYTSEADSLTKEILHKWVLLNLLILVQYCLMFWGFWYHSSAIVWLISYTLIFRSRSGQNTVCLQSRKKYFVVVFAKNMYLGGFLFFYLKNEKGKFTRTCFVVVFNVFAVM